MTKLTEQKIDHKEEVKFWTIFNPLWSSPGATLVNLGQNLCTEVFPSGILSFAFQKLCTTTLLLGNNEVQNDCEQVTTRKIEKYTGLYTNMVEGVEDFFVLETMGDIMLYLIV